MAGSVNQATGLPDFEDVLRTGARVDQDFLSLPVSALTLRPLWLALVASHGPRGGMAGPKLLAEGLKTRSLQWDQFLSKRGGPKSYPCRVPRNPWY